MLLLCSAGLLRLLRLGDMALFGAIALLAASHGGEASAATLEKGINGTRVDAVTGLTWMPCWSGQSWDGLKCVGQASSYTWDQANAITGTVSFAGQSDWRLPTIRELLSLVNYLDATALDSSVFPQNAVVWSSSPDIQNAPWAMWSVNFRANGATTGMSRTNSAGVVLVRGGVKSGLLNTARPISDYVDNGDGTATHVPTGLTWQRCLAGQVWSNGRCLGGASDYTWYQAKALTSNFAGMSDWRLPTEDELASLVDYAKPAPTINQSIFPNFASAFVWSSSTISAESSEALYVGFYTGSMAGWWKSDVSSVIFVRGGLPAGLATPVCTLTATPHSIAQGGSSTLKVACSPQATTYTWAGASGCSSTSETCTVSPSTTTTYSVVGVNAAGAAPPAEITLVVTANSSPIDIRSASFVRGQNVALCTGSCTFGSDTLLNASPYVSIPTAAEWDFVLPVSGTYEVFAEYAAGTSRPTTISFNGVTAFESALSAITGGWMPANRQVLSQGVVRLKSGTNTMRVGSLNDYPHIKGFSLVPVMLVPTCTLTASPETIVTGGATQLTATCSPTATSYIWVGASSCTSVSNTCIVYPGYSATATYSVAGVNAAGTGLLASALVRVTVAPLQVPPSCTITAAPATIVVGESSTLTAVCPGAQSYSWVGTTGCGSLSSTCSVSPSTTTTYGVAGTNIGGTGNTAKVSVALLEKPVCTLRASPSSVVTGAGSTLTAICNPVATSYIWQGATNCSSSLNTCTVFPTSGINPYSVAGMNGAGTGTVVTTVILRTATSILTIPPITNAVGGSSVVSAPINVAGAAMPTSVSLTNGEYQINGGAWTSAAGTVKSGDVIVVRVTASNAPGGEVRATLTIAGVASGSFVVTTASATVPPARLAGKLVNISTRAYVGTGDDVLIAGFIISGGPKRVVIMAEGPSLANQGLNGVLGDPKLTLYSGSTVLQTNDNYVESSDFATLRSLGIFPKHNLEAAIVTTLQPGGYTAIVSGSYASTGIALISVNDMDDIASASRLINISSRAKTATSGDEQVIAGFIVKGGSNELLITGEGPNLSTSGVGGAMPNPAITAMSGSTAIASSDDWVNEPGAAVIRASGIAPKNNLESAMISTLAEGAYTVIMRGVGSGGVGLIAVNELAAAAQLKSVESDSLHALADKAFELLASMYAAELGAQDGLSQSKAGFRYRTYSGAHVLAVNEVDTPHIFYTGLLSGGLLIDLGELSSWLGSVRTVTQ